MIGDSAFVCFPSPAPGLLSQESALHHLERVARPCQGIEGREKQPPQKISTPVQTLKLLQFCCLLLLLQACHQGPSSWQSPDERTPISARVEPYKGRPTIFINNQPELPMIYALPDVPGGRWTWEELPQHNIDQFCRQGIRLYQVDIFLDHIWPAAGQFDLEIARKQVRGIWEVCPEASVFFRFHVNAPKWWVAAHPEEWPVYEEGPASADVAIGLSRILEADPRNPQRASLASRLWLETAGEQLARFCREFGRTEEGSAVAGIQVASGIYGEWHYWGFLKYTADFSEQMKARFRHWLSKKYISDDQLRQAWGQQMVTRNTATIPSRATRALTRAGIFRHPQLDREVIDYFTLQHELVAEDILYFCRIVKESWPRPVITGSFYGYFFSVFGRQAAGGHLALHKVLESEYIDYLSGPQPYYPEDGYQDGEPYRSRSLVHSIYLNGKLWLDEYDQQPRRTWPYISEADNRTRYEEIATSNIAQIRRNVLFPFTKGMGLWFYDFGNASMHLHPRNQHNKQMGTSGYWDNPLYMKPIGEMRKLMAEYQEKEYLPESDVLLVYDTDVILHLPSEGPDKCPITEHVVNWTNLAMYYAGFSFEPVHLDDLPKTDLSRYKLIVFANTFLLEEKDKVYLRNSVLKDERHILWVYAPGYSNNERVDLQMVSDLTGMQLEEVALAEAGVLQTGAAFGLKVRQEARGRYRPMIALADDEAVNLGILQDGSPAFGRKKMEDHTAWYISLPPTSGDLLREVARQSGAHLYVPAPDIVYAGGGLLVVHTANGGGKEIRLRTGVTVQLDLPPGPHTLLLDSSDGTCLICPENTE